MPEDQQTLEARLAKLRGPSTTPSGRDRRSLNALDQRLKTLAGAKYPPTGAEEDLKRRLASLAVERSSPPSCAEDLNQRLTRLRGDSNTPPRDQQLQHGVPEVTIAFILFQQTCQEHVRQSCARLLRFLQRAYGVLYSSHSSSS